MARKFRTGAFFVIGLAISFAFYTIVFLRILGQAFAIGDSPHPERYSLSPMDGWTFRVFAFPFLYLNTYLHRYVDIDVLWFALLNAVFWGVLIGLACKLISCLFRRRTGF